MPKPKRLSGKEVVRIPESFGVVVKRQRGSHVKLVRIFGEEREILTVVVHPEMKIGTLIGVFKQASRYISESELREHFYSE